MKVYDVEQGSDVWHRLRAGRPTASSFSKIVTSEGKLSKQRLQYARQLAAELYAGKPLDTFDNEHTRRGTEAEPAARAEYEWATGRAVTLCGFVTDDDGLYGCSPDGLVGLDGMVQLKTRLAHIQVETILHGEPPGACLQQMQGELMVTGREWIDYASYHPDLPLAVYRVYPNLQFQKSLLEAIMDTIRLRDEMLEKIRGMV